MLKHTLSHHTNVISMDISINEIDSNIHTGPRRGVVGVGLMVVEVRSGRFNGSGSERWYI